MLFERVSFSRLRAVDDGMEVKRSDTCPSLRPHFERDRIFKVVLRPTAVRMSDKHAECSLPKREPDRSRLVSVEQEESTWDARLERLELEVEAKLSRTERCLSLRRPPGVEGAGHIRLNTLRTMDSSFTSVRYKESNTRPEALAF